MCLKARVNERVNIQMSLIALSPHINHIPLNLFSASLLSTNSLLPPPLLSSLPTVALIQCVPTYYSCSTPSFTPSGTEAQVPHSLELFTQTKSCSVSVTKPAKSLWLFHVLSAHGSLLSLGHWPGPWIQ